MREWLEKMAPKERRGVLTLLAFCAGVTLFTIGIIVGQALGAL